MAVRIVVEFPTAEAAWEWFDQAKLGRWFPSGADLVNTPDLPPGSYLATGVCVGGTRLADELEQGGAAA